MSSSVSLTDSEGTPNSISGEDIKLGVGKALQTVKYLTAVQASQTITTVDSVINGMAKVIIPKGNNSQFLVFLRWFGEVTSAWDVCFNIHMNGVRVNINGKGRGYGIGMPMQSYINDDNNSTPEILSIHTLVSTSSVVGVPISFSVVADATSSRTLWTNRCFAVPASAYEASASELIITEIVGV